MKTIALRLIGTPAVLVDGEYHVVAPRLAFETLVLICLSDKDGISRKLVVEHFWSGLDGPHAKATLRTTLHRLRSELVRLGIEGCFDLAGEHLRACSNVSSELERLKCHPEMSWAEVNAFAGPFLAGWSPDRWQTRADEYSALLADTCSLAYTKSGITQECLSALKVAAQNNSTNLKIAQLFAHALSRQNRASEASEAIIEFEIAWVDRFGLSDLPKIEIELPIAPQISVVSRQRANWLAVGLVCASICCLLVGVFIGVSNRRDTQHKFAPDIWIAKTEAIQIHGAKFIIYHLRSNETKPIMMWDLPNGELKFLSVEGNLDYVGRISENALTRVSHPKGYLLGLGSSYVSTSGEHSPLTFTTDSGRFLILTNSSYPSIGGEWLDDANTLEYYRYCSHAGADHVQTVIYRNGIETPISSGLGRTQVCYTTFRDAQEIYARYSLGRSDHWKYHSFKFDLRSYKAEPLSYSPVCCVSNRGDLLTEPEVTEYNSGDYFTHWNHQVQIISGIGKVSSLHYGRLSNFASCAPAKSFVVVETVGHNDLKGFVALDYQSEEIPQLHKYLWDALAVQGADNHDSIFTRQKSGEYLLIQPARDY